MNIKTAKKEVVSLHDKGVSRENCQTLIGNWQLGDSEIEIREYADEVYTKENQSAPLDDTLHDIGNSLRFINQYKHVLRYNFERNLWLFYNGKFWEWDDGAIVTRLAITTAREIYREAAEESDSFRQNELAEHAKTSQSSGRVDAIVKLSRGELAIKVAELNANHFLLNVANGTINLETGELQKHNPLDLITCFIPTEYEPNAKSKIFDAFLDRTFEGKQEIIQFVKRSLGYSCTGDPDEQALWFNKGTGANGKSTLFGAVLDILADYAGEIDPIAFVVDKNARPGPNEALASLYGKRFVISVEIKNAMRLNVSLIKRMTGGESIRCERKFEHGFNFKPTHKLWILANSDPRIDDDTDSIYRRLKYINFNVTIPEGERDKKLRSNLVKNEGKAILAWLVDGCRLWLKEGLQEPTEVKAAVASYRDSQDVLHDYLDEKCLIGAGETGLVSEQYKNYLEWTKENNFEPLGKNNFGSKLKDKGFKVVPGHGNKKFWSGIRPLTALESNQSNPNHAYGDQTLIKNLESFSNTSSRIETSQKNSNQDNQSNPGFCPTYGCVSNLVRQPDGPDGEEYYCSACSNTFSVGELKEVSNVSNQ